jgi:Ricin-type beta-trefoil lectin domain-like
MDKRKWFSLLAACAMLANMALVAGSAAPMPAYAQSSRTFPETGKTVQGVFLEYWNTHGGLAQQGFPISEEIQEAGLDGVVRTTQYFERAVFELHPEFAGTPNEVLLSLLGAFYYDEKYQGNAPGQTASTDNPRRFAETGKTIGGAFRRYWETHGGLAQQGYPISDEFSEVSDIDGKAYTVQYFQRAVFEYHPENQPEFQVLLSLLGVFYYQKKHGGGPAPTPIPTEQALTFNNLATSFCLDSNPSREVYTHVCNGGAYQKWGVKNNNDGTITLQDLATSYCLETNTQNEVHTWDCSGGPYQKWRVQDNNDGTTSFVNPATSFCLDSNASNQVYTHVCNGGPYQRWR